MPELPEVEITRRGLAPAMLDKRIETIHLNRFDLRGGIPADLKDSIQGRLLITTKRRGKYILGFTDSGAGFVLHLGMSGRIRIHAPGEIYKPQKHDHVIFTMSDKTKVVFNDPRRFGMLYSANEKNWERQKPFNMMGPEPLENDFNGKVLAEKLCGKKTLIKTALLDQRIVAGVGNIYACEALFEAGIAPERIASSVSGREAEKLAKAIRDVLNKAIASGGSSLKDYRQTDGSTGTFQHEFSVYDREGEACPGCDCVIGKTGGVVRMVQAGRSTFFCARRQK